MRIGPFNQIDFLRIKRLFEENGFVYEVFVSDDVKEHPERAFRASGYSHYGSAQFLYFETTAEAELAMKDDFSKNLSKIPIPKIDLVEPGTELDLEPSAHPRLQNPSVSSIGSVLIVILIIIGSVLFVHHIQKGVDEGRLPFLPATLQNPKSAFGPIMPGTSR